MTITQSFANWLQLHGFGVQGADLYIGSVPHGAPKAAWWLINAGGTPVIRAQTGEKAKQYLFTVLYRHTDAQMVDEQLQNLEETANSKACHELTDYDVLDMEASGLATDNDIDGEDRSLGSVEIAVTVYQS